VLIKLGVVQALDRSVD